MNCEEKKRTTAEMGEEIVLSIAETNKLRASIGLPLIPDPYEKPSVKKLSEKSLSGAKSHTELSIEETNKLRISIGLKPIPIEDLAKPAEAQPETVNTEDNYKKRLNEAQEKVAKRRKPVKILWEDEEAEETSTSDWLNNLGKASASSKSSKPKPKAKAAAEVDGIAIAHSSKELQDIGDDEIFTLKDTNIIGEDADADELDNYQLTKKAALKKELKEKKEADSLKFNGRRTVEDSEEEEESEEKVLISGSTVVLPQHEVEEVKEPKTGQVQIASLFDDEEDMDNSIDGVSNDYSRSKKKPIKMKKIKKKSLKSREVNLIDDDIPLQTVKLEVDNDVDDDDDLQKVIDAKRKQKQKGLRSKLTAEQIALEVKQFELWDQTNEIEARAQSGGFVLNDTVDFLNSLNAEILAEPEKVIKQEDHVKLEPAPVIKQEETSIETSVKQETTNQETLNQDSIKQEEPGETPIEPSDKQEGPKFNGGLAATLKFLQSRNIIGKVTAESQESAKQQRDAVKEADLLKLQITIEERHAREELESLKQFMNLPRDQREAQIQALVDERLQQKGMVPVVSTKKRSNHSTGDKLDNYNPQVKLSYRDESGQELNTKQAFKFLSHKFHGVGPGKNKMKKPKEEPSESTII